MIRKLINYTKLFTKSIFSLFLVLSLSNLVNLHAESNQYDLNSQFDAFTIAYNTYDKNLPVAPKSDSKSYILIDYNSGSILAEKDANERVEPASLTKIMTMYIVDQELRAGRLSLNDYVKVSKKAWRMQGSRMFIEVNDEVLVEDLIKGVIIQSGNDASVALAEHIAGSEDAFIALMNRAAQELGMMNTHFMNATGMPHKDHYTTAYDLALLSRAIIRDYPESYALYSQKEFKYNNINQFNRNKLLWSSAIDADGIKTGYTESAGYCLAASAEKDGMRLIAIVLGADNSKMRSKETGALLRYGFRFYDSVKLYAKNEPLGKKKIWLGEESKVKVGLDKDLFITIPKGEYKNLSASVETEKYIRAPIEQYQAIGELVVSFKDKIIAKRKVVVLDQIPQGGLWKRFKDRIKLSVDKFFGKEHKIELKQLS